MKWPNLHESYRRAEYADAGVVNLVQLLYEAEHLEGETREYEFSRESVTLHSQDSYRDASSLLAYPEWLKTPFIKDSIAAHDIHLPW